MINDSIRTYVYCILGAQAETRTPITGRFGTELDAQKQFLNLLEDSINQHVDIPISIDRYQKALTDTHKRLDYVIGPGLYIIPSDMILKMGSIENYNNNILLASKDMKPGKIVTNINQKIKSLTPLMEGSTVKKSILKTNPKERETPAKPIVKELQSVAQDLRSQPVENETHETIKFYLFLATGGLVSLALYFSSK